MKHPLHKIHEIRSARYPENVSVIKSYYYRESGTAVELLTNVS